MKDLGFAPRISSTVTEASDAGVYPITFSDNYTSDNCEFHVDGKYCNIAASRKDHVESGSVIDVEVEMLFTTASSSKLPVTFNSSNDAVAVNQIGDAWILTPVTSRNRKAVTTKRAW